MKEKLLLAYWLFFASMICFSDTKAQSVNDTLQRYDIAINYLNNNREQLNTQWLDLFKGSNRRIYKSRIGNGFEFKVSPRICFLPILIFQDEIPNISTVIYHSTTEIKTPSVYSGNYGFDSFVSNYLLNSNLADTVKTLLPNTFVVTFSKPVNNYLLAEVTGTPERLNQCSVKVLGRTMWLLFLFEKDGNLGKVYYSYLDH